MNLRPRPLILATARSVAPWLCLGLLFQAGCAENAQLRRTMAQPYHPSNLHQRSDRLPSTLRRVAVLPLTADSNDNDLQIGVQTLEPILATELRRQAAFEVVLVPRELLRSLSGRSGWQQEDALPPQLLSRIRETTGADGVLFTHLSVYRPYPPIAVGWRMTLIDSENHNTQWSVDEVFDAGSTEVIKAAQAYSRANLNQPSVELDSSAVLASPRRFGQYAAAAALGTLPAR